MPATTKVALGASTTNRKWYLDVDSSAPPHTVPTYVGVFGITEFQDALEPTLQDDSDFDADGYKSQTKSASSWSITLKVARKVTAASSTAYDAGQELLRLAAEENGVANSIPVRWYEMEENGPRVESYKGTAAVTWSPDGGGMDALSTVSLTLSGQGKRTAIAHPTLP